MKNIDLQAIIDKLNLQVEELALSLFPVNKHPVLALKRILKGESYLDSNQIQILSKQTGLSYKQIFDSDFSVTFSSDVHIFKKGEFVAKLDTDSFITKIFKKGELSMTVLHPKSILLKDYINLIQSKFNKL